MIESSFLAVIAVDTAETDSAVIGESGGGGTAENDIRNPTSEKPLHARSPHPGCVLYGLGCVSTQRHSTDTNKQCTHARHTCQMPDHTDARAHCTARSPRGVEVEEGAQLKFESIPRKYLGKLMSVFNKSACALMRIADKR